MIRWIQNLNERTVLIEDKRFTKYWSPETDMRRYTDPAHPDFWQPDWVKQQEKGE